MPFASDSEYVTAKAPGKLILSGEHAVVHGAPALAMAIDKFTQTSIKKASHIPSFLNLQALNLKKSVPFSMLKALEDQFLSKHKLYQSGKALIKDVLSEPLDLAIFTAAKILKIIGAPLKYGLDIQTTSTIPVSCGMGSSAASIVSLIKALQSFLNLNIEDKLLMDIALQAENLQHGQSSGLDLRLSMQGGCLYFQNQKFETIHGIQTPLTIIKTGKPATTTGECVSHTTRFFQQSELIEQFASTTKTMQQAVAANDTHLLHKSIRQNHRLLTAIEVVPQTVNQFIHNLENANISAKISGSGAVYGDNAGIVMALGDKKVIKKIAKEAGYTVDSISQNHGGAALVSQAE